MKSFLSICFIVLLTFSTQLFARDCAKELKKCIQKNPLKFKSCMKKKDKCIKEERFKKKKVRAQKKKKRAIVKKAKAEAKKGGPCYEFPKNPIGRTCSEKRDCRFAKFKGPGSKNNCDKCYSKFGMRYKKIQFNMVRSMRGLKTCKQHWLSEKNMKTCNDKLQKNKKATTREKNKTKDYVNASQDLKKLEKDTEKSGIPGCKIGVINF